MKLILLTIKLALFLYLGYILIFLANAYEPQAQGYSPPLPIFVIDLVNLFIHEAGHFFFKLFGRFLYVLGGSLVQILLPLALLIVTWRQNANHIVYPGFWMGETMVNVSVYIKDAPYKHLKLIARGLIHDWNWLLSDNLDAAEPLGEMVFVLGIVVCAASLGAGVYFAIRNFIIPDETYIPE